MTGFSFSGELSL